MTTPFLRLSATLFPALVLGLLGGCRDKQPAAPVPHPTVAKPAPAPAAPVRTREQAMAALMALPELQAGPGPAGKAAHGKPHGVVIEDDQAPRLVGGAPYYQFRFVQNDKPGAKTGARRGPSFLVARQGDDILVDDTEHGGLLSLSEWRRGIHRVDIGR